MVFSMVEKHIDIDLKLQQLLFKMQGNTGDY